MSSEIKGSIESELSAIKDLMVVIESKKHHQLPETDIAKEYKDKAWETYEEVHRQLNEMAKYFKIADNESNAINRILNDVIGSEN